MKSLPWFERNLLLRILNALMLIAAGELCFAETSDEITIGQIYDKGLSEGKSYSLLDYLSNKIGPRLSGSPGAAAAVERSRHVNEEFGFDPVWQQPGDGTYIWYLYFELCDSCCCWNFRYQLRTRFGGGDQRVDRGARPVLLSTWPTGSKKTIG